MFWKRDSQFLSVVSSQQICSCNSFVHVATILPNFSDESLNFLKIQPNLIYYSLHKKCGHNLLSEHHVLSV